MTEEVWKPIPRLGSWYDASDGGRVRSWYQSKGRRVVPRVLAPASNGSKQGYLRLFLTHLDGSKHTEYIHRLVLEAFEGDAPEGTIGAHLDGDPLNNHPGNLKWATQAENDLHKWLHGTQWRRYGNVKTDSRGADPRAFRRKSEALDHLQQLDLA